MRVCLVQHVPKPGHTDEGYREQPEKERKREKKRYVDKGGEYGIFVLNDG